MLIHSIQPFNVPNRGFIILNLLIILIGSREAITITIKIMIKSGKIMCCVRSVEGRLAHAMPGRNIRDLK